MVTTPAIIAAYSIPFISILSAYMLVRKRREAASRARCAESIGSGLSAPASLHPKIDPARCLGCGACTRACPEGAVLGLIGGKATLIEPASCIGHGACKSACPHGAIELVFGSETRGVELPQVGPDFETNVPGIFIAGELGGMGLVRNAIEQGKRAVASIARLDGLGRSDRLDLVIVGAGPAGLAAALAAKKAALSYVVLEQDRLGGTIAHFPRGKVVMTQPAELPIVGKIRFREVSKEHLLAFWERVVRSAGIVLRCGERVTGIERGPDGGFSVTTSAGRYDARAVLLAIGRRGTPRRLGVPGEDLPKVVYSLADPDQYAGMHVAVVGGGDSAIEAAVALCEAGCASVTLSYRGDAFSRAKPKNRAAVESAAGARTLRVALQTEITAIGPDRIELHTRSGPALLPNDAVIVCAGGDLPTGFLRKIGIVVETKYGTA